MSFSIFTVLSDKINKVTDIFITEITSKSILIITPIIGVGLTISFIIYGIMIMRGVIQAPIMDFLGKYLRISIITTIIGVSGLYQSSIVGAVQDLPDTLVSALISNSSEVKGINSIIDQAAAKGFDQASKAFSLAGFFKTNGISYALFGVIILLTTGTLVAIGGAYLLLTKLALTLLLALGPFFIACLLFQPLKHLFEKWMAQILNYILLVVLFSTVFGLMMDIFGSYMEGVDLNQEINTGSTLGGAIILSVAMVTILRQLPALASSLAGGISLNPLGGLPSMGQGASLLRHLNRETIKSMVTQSQSSQGYFKGNQIASSNSYSNGKMNIPKSRNIHYADK